MVHVRLPQQQQRQRAEELDIVMPRCEDGAASLTAALSPNFAQSILRVQLIVPKLAQLATAITAFGIATASNAAVAAGLVRR